MKKLNWKWLLINCLVLWATGFVMNWAGVKSWIASIVGYLLMGAAILFVRVYIELKAEGKL